MENVLKKVLFACFAVCALLLSIHAPANAAATASAATVAPVGEKPGAPTPDCQPCHAAFFKTWTASPHGTSLRPMTPELAKTLPPQSAPVVIKGKLYRFGFDDKEAWVMESATDAQKKYPVAYVLGGKKVSFFLTPMERGLLQVLPTAYDQAGGAWIDPAQSPVAHFPDRLDPAASWTDRRYAFSTSCRACHAGQSAAAYDSPMDAYTNDFARPGLSCAACHGPVAAHAAAPKEAKVIHWKGMDATAKTSACAACHAKAVPLTGGFSPGAPFFDNFDLATLENPDFTPGGKNVKGGFTMTAFSLSPCAAQGKLDCLHCHDLGGNFRFAAAPDQACQPCHAGIVEKAAEHSRHKAGTDGAKCVSCHMPRGANSGRDHSMSPPAPAETQAFGAQNACNACHADKDAAWADAAVKAWGTKEYQAPLLARATLVEAARKGEWNTLPDMIAYLNSKDKSPVYAASLLRLMRACPDPARIPAAKAALGDASPLVRAAAVQTLGAELTAETFQTLIQAATDPSRLVRVKAAEALSPYPVRRFTGAERGKMERAFKEYLASLSARPDLAGAHQRLGDFFSGQGEPKLAIQAYETASMLDPRALPPLVNVARLYVMEGKPKLGELKLKEALGIDPKSLEARYNLGLLLAESGQTAAAEAALRQVLAQEPDMAEAAYNLGVLLYKDRPDEALAFTAKARDIQPDNPKYVYSLAFFENKAGQADKAVALLQGLIEKLPDYPFAYPLLGEILTEQGKTEAALATYEKALKREDLPQELRDELTKRIDQIKARETS